MEMCRQTLPFMRREMIEYAAQCWDTLEPGQRRPNKRRGKTVDEAHSTLEPREFFGNTRHRNGSQVRERENSNYTSVTISSGVSSGT